MAGVNKTDRILEQGQALVHAIDALEIVEPTGTIRRVQSWFLLQAHRRRLRAIAAAAAWRLAEKTLGVCQAVGKDRAAVWLSDDLGAHTCGLNQLRMGGNRWKSKVGKTVRLGTIRVADMA